MTRKTAVTALGALAVGFGLGAVVFRESAPPPVPPLERRAPPAAEPLVKVVERERVVSVPAPAPAPAAPSVPPECLIPAPCSITALDQKLEALERQLAIERQLRIGTEGERVDPPKDLPKRFRDEKQLLETFNAAFKAAGFPDAQVENIDCTEHPCIVYGRGFGDRNDLERLKPFLGAYQKDDFSTFGFMNGEGASAKRFFGVGVMPQDSDRDDALHKRLNHRVQQMYEVSKPTR